eukprot:TRINITY_DN5327_c0_g1_i1.p1 TRINITY_DN5327_c0_g1~~TRINITY_DN5327_c0_g1_i1.p1  ORF type:complete len:134 (-),score=10.95 TRINITY_DN5327_c0_g1_i1:2108-2509(-)
MRASINRPPTPDGDEDPQQELTLQEIINIKLIESGEKEKLKELLRERLIECGWRDEMKALCRFFQQPKYTHKTSVNFHLKCSLHIIGQYILVLYAELLIFSDISEKTVVCLYVAVIPAKIQLMCQFISTFIKL